ncbi:MAG: MBL fold metallo-hydrolase [Rhodospirillales bacterium]|nr:MBL fold metallo-hydrolase [Rhodospirillales bacterium]
MRRAVRSMLAGLIGLAALSLAAPGVAQAPGPQFDLTKVADNVYSFRFGVAFHRNMVVLTNDGVIVSDPLNPMAAQHMMDEIKKITSQPVKLVIYSHNHWDHIAGARIFKDQGARVLQHELAAKNTRPHPAVVPADETFAGDKHVVSLGGETIELIYVGPSHGSGTVVMRLPRQRILHTVDIVTPGRLAFRGMPDFYPQDWIVALKKVEQLDFDRIIPGHGPASAPKSTVTEQREYIEDLGAAVAKAVKTTGNPFAFDKLTELVKDDLRPKYGKWAQFDDWMGMNVERMTFEQRIGW